MLIDPSEYRCISTLTDKRVEHIPSSQRSADQWQRTCPAKQVAIAIVISTVNQIGAASHASSSSGRLSTGRPRGSPLHLFSGFPQSSAGLFPPGRPVWEIDDSHLWVMKLPAPPVNAPTPGRRVRPASCPASPA